MIDRFTVFRYFSAWSGRHPRESCRSAQMEARIDPSYCKEVRAHPVKLVDGESSQNSVVRIFFDLVKGARSAHLRPLIRLLIPYMNLNSSYRIHFNPLERCIFSKWSGCPATPWYGLCFLDYKLKFSDCCSDLCKCQVYEIFLNKVLQVLPGYPPFRIALNYKRSTLS